MDYASCRSLPAMFFEVATQRPARPFLWAKRDGQVVIRKMMNLSSSFDHRIVDGWEAAAFIQRVKHDLEQPALLFID